MPYGYAGRILHVNLTDGSLEVEQPDEQFYRTYMGGSALAMHYILNEVPAGIDPLGPENVLVVSIGVMTGAPSAARAGLWSMPEPAHWRHRGCWAAASGRQN